MHEQFLWKMPADLRSVGKPSSRLSITVHIPELGGRNPNDTTAKPPARITMEQTPSITTESHVILLLVDNHCSSDHRQLPKQSCI